jgi:hypothetical protein
LSRGTIITMILVPIVAAIPTVTAVIAVEWISGPGVGGWRLVRLAEVSKSLSGSRAVAPNTVHTRSVGRRDDWKRWASS